MGAHALDSGTFRETVGSAVGTIMGCKVSDLVRPAYPSMDERSRVMEAAHLMAERDLGSVVVTREGRPVGIFTERDLLKRVVSLGLDPATVILSEVCSRNLVSIAHDSSCREAVRAMQANLCRRLLVYRNDQFMGVLKLTDLAHAMAGRGYRSDLLVNAMVLITFALAIGVIAALLFQFPEVYHMAARNPGP